MDKNEREKNFLYEWGAENRNQYVFPEIERNKESYFMKRGEGDHSYIREYGFNILPELIKELNTQWEQDEVLEKTIKVLGIAAIKNKPVDNVKEKTEVKERQETENKLPVFIYNF